MNWKVRMRNPWFWVGIVSAVVSALRVDVNALTSWGTVWSCLARIIENPVQLGTLCLTVLSVFIDPTTAGLGDSARALTYRKPADFSRKRHRSRMFSLRWRFVYLSRRRSASAGLRVVILRTPCLRNQSRKISSLTVQAERAMPLSFSVSMKRRVMRT